eukprot:5787995-Pyramimonas_sp.AAC.1
MGADSLQPPPHVCRLQQVAVRPVARGWAGAQRLLDPRPPSSPGARRSAAACEVLALCPAAS